MIIHNFMNINSAWFYASADSEKQKNHITKNACFDCDQKEHQYKNCLTNSYSKIHQAITSDENEWAVSFRKTYTASVTSLKMSDKKHSTSFHIITSHIMSSDESENESFWNQVTFRNTRKKNLWCIYAFWTLIKTIRIIHFSTWLMKYNSEENE